MRSQFLKAVVMISVLIGLSAVSTRAQAGNSFTVTVPFEFSVSGKTLPAGEYTVIRVGVSRDALTMCSKDGKGSASALTKTIETRDIQNQTKIVFRRYGKQYFLSQVWISGRSTGRELFTSKEQLKIERELTRGAAKPGTIAVVAQKR